MLSGSKAKLKTIAGVGSAKVYTDAATVLFNPSDISIDRSVNYAEHKIPGRDRPVFQFINGEAEVLKVSLFFDTYSSGLETGQLSLTVNNKLATPLKKDVREFTDPVYELLEIDSDTHAPKQVKFEWGSISFEGVIVALSQKFTQFSPSGTPLRSVIEFTMKSLEKGNIVKNSPDRTKSRVVVEGDKLYSFAYAEYGDCGKWRTIAQANNIDNPRMLKSGSRIAIPAIT